jgi:uncharacterized membrane protein YebE (DUF533 family)
MSLMKTLAKVAIGVAVAKGAQNMMKGGSSNSAGGGGGLGDLLKNMTQQGGGGSSPFGGANSPGGGGLQDALGGLLGGSQSGGGVGNGGLGGLLEQIGGAQGGGQSGGLGGLIGGLAQAAGQGGGGAAGGLGGLLGGLTGAMQGKAQQSDSSFGEVFNSQFDETPVEAIEPSADQEAAAALMLRAMIQATKADGELDDAEKAAIVERLGGDVDQQEAAFVQAEMQRPLDVDGLVADTPRALGPQVYAMSVLGINLDSQAEAQYLHKLAQGFGMEPGTVNSIHDQLGVPQLYS